LRKNPLSNISARGGIITSEFLERIRSENVKHAGVLPDSFRVYGDKGPANTRELTKQMREAWNELQERWDSISTRYRHMSASEARSKWIIPLLRGLGFDPIYNRQDVAVDREERLVFRLSHRGWQGSHAPMIHTVAPIQDLEQRPTREKVHGRHQKRSPHEELQVYLNVNKRHKWGIVTNGILFRILREFYHTTTKGYVEFDLENIFLEKSFTDFRTLYRVAHASRFLIDKERQDSLLEQFYKESIAAGIAIGANLRQNVKRAIEALGNGFMTESLAEKMIEDEELCSRYYSELLKVVYRILFLLFAEQRAMLPTRDSLYAEEYSLTRLREIAETRQGKDDHLDLWEGLKVTFRMLENGCPSLGVFGYNGSLFDDSGQTILSELSGKNKNILLAIRDLTLVEEERVLKRINYLDIGVEEIGSIYESLLEFMPRVYPEEKEVNDQKIPAKTFFLDPLGSTRRATGSYYTDPHLIDELVRNALEPVLEDTLKKASNKETALLSLKLCDPACGSGAFLIAANNYLAKELAKLRTGEEEPSEREIRKGRRDVLQHCIFGVDLNPMAVELAKVSLWINASVEDMPLNFLNHHIKCGDSLIGASQELIRKGIPDNAFAPGIRDDKNISKETKKRNKEERNQRVLVEYFVDYEQKWSQEYKKLTSIEESTPHDVQEKQSEYLEIIDSEKWKNRKLLFDTWCSAFFWHLNNDEPRPPTEAIIRLLGKDVRSVMVRKLSETIIRTAENRKFFHWELEFPDVFGGKKKGFDCILGNPPFIGGLKIRGEFGEKYRNYLSVVYSPFIGTSDLCAAFYRRVYQLLKPNGMMGMVATNTIGQGDTRESGLAIILKNQGTITFAQRFVKWIGAANVEVNLIAIKKGLWKGQRLLDNVAVPFISSRLDDQLEIDPKRLVRNENKAFIGDYVRGIGFVLGKEEAEKLILGNPKNRDCLLPFLTGEDFNTNPKMEPSREVICFRDWPLEKALEYSDLINIVETKVKPFRDKLEEKHDRENWWLFARYRGELREAIANLKKIIVRSRVSELHMLSYTPTNICCSDATVVFAFDDSYHFSILQSCIHEIWVRKFASTLRTDIRYTPSDCFETFPFPYDPSEDDVKATGEIGFKYYEHRKQIMHNRNIGLTCTYNLIHNSEVNDEEIKYMRELIVKMDMDVLKCYGWSDIDTQHCFYPNERGKIRFGIILDARKEMLNRLLNLNIELSKKEKTIS